MTWESLDWEVLDRLRETFISGDKTAGPYWHTITDLECYDFTYGERIGWKWDAVLRELKARGWTPAPAAINGAAATSPRLPTAGEVSRAPITILDWGCGSGIAGRRVVEAFGPATFSRLVVHDHSTLALDYAEHRGRQAFPGLAVERASTRDLRGTEPIGLLVVSHVVNELTDTARAELADLCARAQAILWVEPGTHESSRLLGAWREQLRESFRVVAPCPHAGPCGVLAAGNERHWCHFFADPPTGLYADSGWVKFGQRAGIDLRALPYSFLVLDRCVGASLDDAQTGADEPRPYKWSRILGHARVFKGYAKLFACDATGVAELMLQKRDAPALFKQLKQGVAPSLHRWTHENGRITGIESKLTTNEHE
jgi:diadenosine tetraphosphatase ApaH/serine/threonine PP2A family protein phosphatase